MQKSRLVVALKTLDDKDWKRLGHLLRSSFFNTNAKIIDLFDYLHQFRNDWNSTKLDAETVYKVIFPNTKYRYQSLRNLISTFNKYLKQYFISEQIEEESDFADLLHLRQLRKRQLVDHYATHSKLLEQKLKEEQLETSRYYHLMYLLGEEEESYQLLTDHRENDSNLQEMMDHLDVFYFRRKLELFCEMTNRQKILNNDYSLHFSNTIKQALAEGNYEHLSILPIQLQYQALLCLTDEREVHFEKLVQLLDEAKGSISNQEMLGFYRYAQNYCIRKINTGENVYLEKLYLLYKKTLSQEILLQYDGNLPVSDFSNIVAVGLRLKDFEWVKNFIDTYQHKLPSEQRDNAYFYNLASYYYSTRQFDAVTDLLLKTNFSDVFHEINAKYILLKTYYDNADFGLLSYAIVAFEKYIKRNKKIAGMNRPGIISFVQILKKLAKLKENSKLKANLDLSKQQEKLLVQIEKKGPITNVAWLREKIAEFG